MKYKLKIILILLAFVLSISRLNAQNDSLIFVKNRFEQSLILEVSKKIEQSKNNIIVIRTSGNQRDLPVAFKKYKSTLHFDDVDSLSSVGKDSKIIFKSGDTNKRLKIVGLRRDTSYMVDIYDNFKYLTSYNFCTLAMEPASNVSRIYWSGSFDDQLNLLFSGGLGSGRIVFVSDSKRMPLPVDGINYQGSPVFGKGEKVSDSTYCVLGTLDSNYSSVRILNLSPGTRYVIAVYDFNGKNDSTNYKNDTLHLKNIIPLYTLPKVPEIIKPEYNPTGNNLKLLWKKSNGASTYVFDISSDNKFENILENYNEVDVGDVDNFLIDDLDLKLTYYFRIKAVGIAGNTEYSKAYKIRYK